MKIISLNLGHYFEGGVGVAGQCARVPTMQDDVLTVGIDVGVGVGVSDAARGCALADLPPMRRRSIANFQPGATSIVANTGARLRVFALVSPISSFFPFRRPTSGFLPISVLTFHA
jgi:hypothetical protein